MSYILALPNVHCYKRKFCIVFFQVYHHGYIDCKQNWVLYKEFKNKWLYALSHTLNVSIFIFLSTCLHACYISNAYCVCKEVVK